MQDSKVDWNALVKKSTTGISNPREYQMLWRHLAYRDALFDRLDDTAAQPLDDDSDLECELEAFPAVSNEALAEAAACVKVLIASGPSDPNGSTVEAPLTINIPKGQTSKAPENSHCNVFAQGTNITVPVSVQKPSLPSVGSAEALDSNGAANTNLPRRKRKAWSAAEDLELIAAVQKFGEGNWANILKGDFKSDRTASQLSQRWAIIKKRQGNLNLGTGSQLSEAQLAARRAVSLALNMPMGDTLKSSPSTPSGMNASVANSKLGPPHSTETPSIVTPLQPDSVSTAGHQIGSSKSRVTTKKPSTKSTISPDSMVKAAAVAAGARIATPSDAATLLKAAQSKNAVHIMPGGSVLKSSMAGNGNSLPSNVHFIRTGLASKPLSTYSTAAVSSSQIGGTQQVLGTSSKPAVPVNQPNSAGTAQELSALSEVKNAAMPGPVSGLKSKTVEDSATFLCSPEKELLQENQAGFKCDRPNEQMKGDLTADSVDIKPNQVPEDQGASENLCIDQPEGGQASVMGEMLKEHASGDEVSASANAFTKKAGGLLDSQSSSMAASNGHLGAAGNQASTTFDSMTEDDVMDMPVKCTGDKPVKEMFENNNMAKRGEGLIMDLDGNDGQANVNQQEAIHNETK